MNARSQRDEAILRTLEQRIGALEAFRSRHPDQGTPMPWRRARRSAGPCHPSACRDIDVELAVCLQATGKKSSTLMPGSLVRAFPQYPDEPCGGTLCGDWRMNVATASGLAWL